MQILRLHNSKDNARMENEDESTSYLKFLNDTTTQNYLLQNTDGFTDILPVESIFTEINPDWPSEGFPILLSGPLVAEENCSTDADVQLLAEETTNSPTTDDSNSNTVTFFENIEIPDQPTTIPSNNLILTNDVLLQLKQTNVECDDSDVQINEDIIDDKNTKINTVTHVINGNTYSITTYTPQIDIDETLDNGNEQVVQLLNVDGSVTTINKDSLNLIESTNEEFNDDVGKFEDFYCEIKAYKCKVCSFLSETIDDITGHINNQHGKELRNSSKNITIINDNVDSSNLIGAKLTSILNNNRETKLTMFLCSECGNGYSNKEDLKQHMVMVHNLVCIKSKKVDKVVSNIGFSNSDNIQTNKTDVGINKLIESNEKTKQSVRNLSAALLKKQQKSMKKIKCSIKGCPLRFAKDDLRQRHEDCHINQEKNKFQCSVCKQKFSMWRLCNMHLWKCHSIDLGLLSCPVCNEFKSNSSVRMINHMSIHNDERPFICKTCGKGFKQAPQLRNHEVTHQSRENVPNWLSVKQCEFCDRYFTNAKCLKKHIKFVHDKFKPFICNICGHQTSRKAMLQLHYRQHTGDKPHQCSYCDYKTGDHNCLRRHLMRHFGVVKYSCPYCSYQCIQTTSYKQHLANKHPGKEGIHSCTTCNYTTVNVAAYLSHVKCHELDKKRSSKSDKINVKPVVNGENTSKSNDIKDNPAEDDETTNCFNNEQSEETVDTGGITIPADFDLPLVT